MFGGWMAYGLHKKIFKWRTEMRKMKKFLAVALSAAMVLSVSVPAMAANASNTETALRYADWETADKDLEQKQKDYDTAEYNLQKAKTALETVKNATQGTSQSVTADTVRAAEDAAKLAQSKLDETKQKAKDAKDTALIAASEAADAYEAYTNAEESLKTAQTAYEKVMADETSTSTQKGEALENLNNAKDAVTRTKDAYFGNVEKGIVGKKEKAETAEDAATGWQAEVQKILVNTAMAVGLWDGVQAINKANGNYADAVAEKEAEVAAAKEARDAALKALNEAKETERAARAKLDSARQKVAQANYDKAVINEQHKAEAEDAALAALNGANDELTAIQERINGYLADIDAYYTSWEKYDDAVDDTLNAAADRVAAKAKLDTAEYLLEVAGDAAENVPNIVEAYNNKLENALADENYLVATDIESLVESRGRVTQARKELQTMMTTYPEDVAAVQENAWAFYATCDDEYNRAEEAYQLALDNVENARLAVDDAFDKEQKAVKALYVTVDSGLVHEYADEDKTPATIYKPVSEATTTTEAGIPLDRYEGKWVHVTVSEQEVIVGVYKKGPKKGQPKTGMRKVVVPETDEKGALIIYTPNKLDFETENSDTTGTYRNSAYRMTHNIERQGAGVYVFVDSNRKTLTNKEEPTEPIPAVLSDNRYYDYTAGELKGDYTIAVPSYATQDAQTKQVTITPQASADLTGVSARWLDNGNGETMRIPVKGGAWIAVAPYAQEVLAKDNVQKKTTAYDNAKDAHELAIEDLNAAIEEYEYCFGHKPGEMNQATEQIVAGFTDVSVDDWFAEYVADVVDKGLMTGYAGNTKFGPFDNLQRQDFAVILYRMADEPEVQVTSQFKDVDKNAYYAKAVSWAAQNGIVKGYADTGFTVFGVGDNITREDFTVMLHRYNKFVGPKATITGFTDASKVSGYAVDAVKWAVSAGAISGKTAADGSKYIDPQAPIARCESAKILSILTD
jgi:hypothetical protein